MAAYKNIEEWILTVDAAESTCKKFLDISFAQEFSLKNNVLEIRISGRLDTINAPKFLQEYEKFQNKFTEINIDATELEFISYAGLRVFKIMRESLTNENLFKIKNANEDAGKILTENGYKITDF